MQFTDIAPDAIEPSPSNPRRRRKPAADAELMASVSTYGILTPLLVRPAAEPGKVPDCGRSPTLRRRNKAQIVDGSRANPRDGRQGVYGSASRRKPPARGCPSPR